MRNNKFRIDIVRVVDIVKRFKCEETGATAIEYGLMAGLISVGIITGAGAIGGSIEQTFTEIGELLQGPPEPPSAGLKLGGGP